MMIIGTNDSKDYIKSVLDWSNKNLDSVQFFPIMPIPGTKLEKRMYKEGRVLREDYYLRDGHHVLLQPDKMSAYDMQKEVLNLTEKFYSVKNSLKRIKRSPRLKASLGLLAYTLMGGVRRVTRSNQMKEHLEYLR